MHKLCVYVPTEHVELVKQALFEAGAGKIGNYDSCCWQTLGTGQFRALEGSEPFLGQQGVVEQVEEYKLEMVCDDQFIKAVLTALRAAHPYEEPAFDLVKLEDTDQL
ncbi:MAG: YqfO family protein [Pseudomonadales bacterium]|nr:YqfO family protein [Pseudomonadales bacterium]